MNKKIKSWALLGLIATLGACGGSDTTTTTTATDTDTTTTPDTVDTVTDVENSNLGLADGVGTAFTVGVAKTGQEDGEVLSASGSTSVTVYIVNTAEDNKKFLGARDVFFTSTCAQVGLAEFSPEKLKVSGEAKSTYIDKGCGKLTGDTDTIVVTLGEEDIEGNITQYATATAEIDVAAAIVGAIQFVQADFTVIAIKGSGTADTPSLSQLEFQVLDASGNPMPDRTVNFSLDHEFGDASLSLESAITNQEGKVLVILKAGNAAGDIRVKASLDVLDAEGNVDYQETTLSPSIVMATSLGDENSFSLGADIFNPRGWDFNNTEVAITANLADHYQNPVLDGTQIYFTATGGMIEESCKTVKGKCTAKWWSADPRPVDGYVTILAHTRGQGNYNDKNANGLFDLGESFESFGEAFIDANGNGSFETEGAYQPDLDVDNDGNPEFFWGADSYLVNVNNNGTYSPDSANFFEEFVDSNNNQTFDGTPTLFYQGVNCAADAVAAGHCEGVDDNTNLIDVTSSLRLQMSAGSDHYFEGPFTYNTVTGRYDILDQCVPGDGTLTNVAWLISDSKERKNTVPMGTKITAVGDDVEIKGENGTGTIGSTYPSLVLPVWEAIPENSAKTAAVRRHDYLNDKGTLVVVGVTEPDTPPTNSPGYGSLKIEVDRLDGTKVSSPTVFVDLDSTNGVNCP